MIFGLLLAVFVAPALCGNASQAIDTETLASVFGIVNSYPALPAATALPSQVAAVSPATLVDPEYWDASDFSPAGADYDAFDWALTKRVASTSSDNFLLSPLGLKLALAILTEAATGQTQAELSAVLGFDLDRNTVRMKFANIIKSVQTKHPQYILNLGSRIYVGDNANPRQRFAAIAKDSYYTDITPLDFSKPVEAAKGINAWIANITEGRITHLVNSDDVASVAVMVLNTLYFKGTWRHQFPPNATKNGPFFVNSKVQKQIPFMNLRGRFYYADSSKFNAKILRMPYLGNKNSMYIIVPNSILGLSQILGQLNELRTEMIYLQDSIVDVTLPRFHFEYTSLLDGTLRDLGIRQAFEDTASFPGIARGQTLKDRLKISKVLQRSGIEVNELGSVAYSATEISLVNKFGEDSYTNHEVIANKPFIFFIQDEQTKQLLFTGRVSDPSLADGSLKS